MTASAHILVAGAIASSITQQPIGLALSFISHPLLDIIPHWDLGWGWRQKSKIRLFIECVCDLMFGLLVTYLIFGQKVNLTYFLACVFLSVSWDILEAPYWFLKWNFPPFSTIYKLQSPIQGKAKLPWGVITQAVSVMIIIILTQKLT